MHRLPNEIEALYDLTYHDSNTSEIQYNCFKTDIYYLKDSIYSFITLFR